MAHEMWTGGVMNSRSILVKVKYRIGQIVRKLPEPNIRLMLWILETEPCRRRQTFDCWAIWMKGVQIDDKHSRTGIQCKHQHVLLCIHYRTCAHACHSEMPITQLLLIMRSTNYYWRQYDVQISTPIGVLAQKILFHIMYVGIWCDDVWCSFM